MLDSGVATCDFSQSVVLVALLLSPVGIRPRCLADPLNVATRGTHPHCKFIMKTIKTERKKPADSGGIRLSSSRSSRFPCCPLAPAHGSSQAWRHEHL